MELLTQKPELLAPAGSLEKMKTAIHYGADAVYFGLSNFSLRARAGNFDEEGINEAIKYAHEKGVKCYVTINVFPHNRDLSLIREHVKFLNTVKPDGAIVSDLGVFEILRSEAPNLPVHISTQANVTNYETARFWKRQGAERLILAREVNVEQISEIRDKVDIELECFVHGSVCISYSGRCYMSALMVNRSANMGECAHPCRWNYTLMEEKRPGEYFPVFEDDRGTYVMSSRDLCMIEHLDRLAEAGIVSFKIEGRMKGINYIAGAVKTYREAIDALVAGDGSSRDQGLDGGYRVDERWMRELQMLSSRGYTTGMYLGEQDDGHYNHDEDISYKPSHTLVGVILEREEGRAKVLMRNRLFPGDRVEFYTPGLEDREFEIDSIEDERNRLLESTRNDEIVWFKVPEQVREGDLIRKRLG